MLFPFFILFGCFVNTTTQRIEKGYCPTSSGCTWVYPYYLTQNVRCVSRYECPVGYVCCPDCHYQHNICKAPVWLPAEDLCPQGHKFCAQPMDYEKTKYYKCTSHAQCYKTDLCCPDSCYTHKVCKSQAQQIQDPHYVCPTSIRKSSCPNTNRILSKYSCKTDYDCFPGYICCKDNCYDHSVCKLPKDAFTYRSVYKPSTYTTPSSFDERLKCPKVEEKCLTPYSLRLAKKFICFKDEDCKVGQLCCKDACVKEFRICKDLFTLKPTFSEFVTQASLPGKEWATQAFPKISTTIEVSRTQLAKEYGLKENSKDPDLYFEGDYNSEEEGSGSGFQDEED